MPEKLRLEWRDPATLTPNPRIGNSVPPLFMEAIARHIREKILKC